MQFLQKLICSFRFENLVLLPHPYDPSDPVTTADVQLNQTASGAIVVAKIRELLKNGAVSGVRND